MDSFSVRPTGRTSLTAKERRTHWGWIAWLLRGAEGYKILRKDDEARVAPGGDDILKLLGDAPNLILPG